MWSVAVPLSSPLSLSPHIHQDCGPAALAPPTAAALAPPAAAAFDPPSAVFKFRRRKSAISRYRDVISDLMGCTNNNKII